MTKIQIVETEELLQYADFDSCEVRLLNRMSYNELDARVINEPELTESPLPSSMKLPQLLSSIWGSHPNKEVTNERGGLQLRYCKSSNIPVQSAPVSQRETGRLVVGRAEIIMAVRARA